MLFTFCSPTHHVTQGVREENSPSGSITRNLAVFEERYVQQSKYLLFWFLYSALGWSNNDLYPKGIWD